MRHFLLEAGLDDHVDIESAGTGAWHVGKPADRRAQAAARRHGIALNSVAREITQADLDEFDLVLAG